MKEALRSLPKKVSRPAVPFAVGMAVFLGSFVDIGITNHNASNDASKVFPPKASREDFTIARRELHIFDELIIAQAHSKIRNIDVSQIPRQSEAMQALDLINQETKISQERVELHASLANRSLKRQLGLMATGFSLMAIGGIWDRFQNQKLRRNKNKIVSAEPA